MPLESGYHPDYEGAVRLEAVHWGEQLDQQSLSFDIDQPLPYADRGMAVDLQFTGYGHNFGFSFRGTVFPEVALTQYFYLFVIYVLVVFLMFAHQLVPTFGPNGFWCTSWQGPHAQGLIRERWDSKAWGSSGEPGYTARVPLDYF